MNIKSVKCPECGANLLMHEGEELMFCSHCGTQLYISPYDERKKYEFSFNEKSRMQKLKNQEALREREERERAEIRRIKLEEEQKFSKVMWRFRFVRWALFALTLIVFFLEMKINDRISIVTLLFFVAYCFVLLISIVNFIIHTFRQQDIR